MSDPAAAGKASRTNAKIAVMATAAPATRAKPRAVRRRRWLSFEGGGNGVSPVHIINHCTIHPACKPPVATALFVFNVVGGRVGLITLQTARWGDESEKVKTGCH